MKIFSPDSKVIRFLTLIGNLMLLNLCFLLCSVPVLTIGASASALYAVVMRIYRQEDSGSMIAEYWKAFRANFGKGTLLGLIYLAIFGLLAVDYVLMQTGRLPDSMLMKVLLGAGGLIFSISLSWVFALQARFENSILGTIRNSLILAFTNLPVTFTVTILTVAPFFVLYYRTDLFLKMLPVWVLLTFSGIAYINGILFHKVFAPFAAEAQNGPQTEPEPDDCRKKGLQE